MQKETRQGQNQSQLVGLNIRVDCLLVRRGQAYLWKLRETGCNLQFLFK